MIEVAAETGDAGEKLGSQNFNTNMDFNLILVCTLPRQLDENFCNNFMSKCSKLSEQLVAKRIACHFLLWMNYSEKIFRIRSYHRRLPYLLALLDRVHELVRENCMDV